MNYRHIYHAGNFADVFKHAVLTRIILYLQRKEAAFRVIDTHAGIGIYNLSSEAALKTGEWRDGIGRLAEGQLPANADAALFGYCVANGRRKERFLSRLTLGCA
jgi:23S rRNA (adenine2030-N6)-methyltransferase